LFLVNVVDEFLIRGWIRTVEGQWAVQEPLAALAGSVPDSLRQLIEQQLERLATEERRVLEVGRVGGGGVSKAAEGPGAAARRAGAGRRGARGGQAAGSGGTSAAWSRCGMGAWRAVTALRMGCISRLCTRGWRPRSACAGTGGWGSAESRGTACRDPRA